METDDKIKVLEALSNLKLKERITNWMLVAFFLILLYIFFWPADWRIKTVLTILDGALSHTIYPIVKHYFPAIKEAKAAEKRAKKLPPPPKTNTLE